LSRLWRARYLASRKRTNRQNVIEHHGGILAALMNRDVDAFRAALGVHLDHLPDDLAEIAADETPHANAPKEREGEL
jgi:DNA-binding GntR family transcriptional regulator